MSERYWTNFARKKAASQKRNAEKKAQGGAEQARERAALGGRIKTITGTEKKKWPKECWTIEKELDGENYSLTKIEMRRGEPPCFTWTETKRKIPKIIYKTEEEAREIEKQTRGKAIRHQRETRNRKKPRETGEE